MDSSQSNFLQLAKQGSPVAIAELLNRSLHSKNINAKVALRNSCLHIMLESNQIPDREELTEFIRRGINNLGSPLIKQVKVYGKQLGQDLPEWNTLIDFDNSESQSIMPEKIKVHQTISNDNKNQNKREFINAQEFLEILVEKTNYAYQEISTFFRSKGNKRKKIAVLVLLSVGVLGVILSVSNSIFSNNPQKVVEGYYKALKEGDKSSAKKYLCIADNPIIYSVRNWKILGQEEKSFTLDTQNLIANFPGLESNVNLLDKLSGRKYSEVPTRVYLLGEDGSLKSEVHKVVVWRTQDIRKYVEAIKSTEDFIKVNVPSSSEITSASSYAELDTMTNRSIAQSKFFVSTVGLSGREEDLTSETYCIQKYSKE